MTGVLALLTGLAYVTIGAIAVSELLRHRRDRGFSHFGLGLVVMAATCGPHHLIHAWRHLVGQEPAHGPMLAAMALSALPAAVFVGLRIEAGLGGRGDRLIRNSRILAALPWLLAAAAGATLWEALRHASAIGVDLRSLLPNLILFANYALVGYFTARTQVARRPLLDGWSLSGVSLSAVFATCAISHLVAGMLTTADPVGVVFDNLAVPASIYFLWAVYRLHRDSARDWNRRPLVGSAAPRGRRSPWAEQGA
jgi:hypothetical protein